MPAIVAIPQVVEALVAQFGDLFPNEPSRYHFAQYLTGLLVAEHKTVSGIARAFARAPDQSCLNRFLTEAPWEADRINAHRLAWLQNDPSTRYRQDGVIAIDNTLIAHDGKLIEDAGSFWDHADKRHLIAHDELFANYVHPSGKHYPLDFRRFRKREQRDEQHPCKNHTDLVKELIDGVVAEQIPGDFTFDRSFTNTAMRNHIHSHQRTYTGDLKAHRAISVSGEALRVSAWAASITPLMRTTFTVAGHTQWSFTTSVRVPKVAHPVRILLLWSEADPATPRKILITNRTHGEAHRLLNVSKRRWTGTETFHRDGKQHLGMGACQRRSGLGQTRPMHVVVLVYTARIASVEARPRP